MVTSTFKVFSTSTENPGALATTGNKVSTTPSPSVTTTTTTTSPNMTYPNSSIDSPDGDNSIPIIVGSVSAAVVVIAIIVVVIYLRKRRKKLQQQKQQDSPKPLPKLDASGLVLEDGEGATGDLNFYLNPAADDTAAARTSALYEDTSRPALLPVMRGNKGDNNSKPHYANIGNIDRSADSYVDPMDVPYLRHNHDLPMPRQDGGGGGGGGCGGISEAYYMAMESPVVPSPRLERRTPLDERPPAACNQNKGHAYVNLPIPITATATITALHNSEQTSASSAGGGHYANYLPDEQFYGNEDIPSPSTKSTGLTPFSERLVSRVSPGLQARLKQQQSSPKDHISLAATAGKSSPKPPHKPRSKSPAGFLAEALSGSRSPRPQSPLHQPALIPQPQPQDVSTDSDDENYENIPKSSKDYVNAPARKNRHK